MNQLNQIEKIRMLPKVDAEDVVRYDNLLEELFGKGIEDYVYADKVATLTKERKKILNVFGRFKEDEDYYKFKIVLKRLTIYDYETVMVILYWYIHFLNKQNIVDDSVVVKGYKTVQDNVIVRLEDKKVFGVDDIETLERLNQRGELNFQETEMKFDKNEDGKSYRLRFETVKEGTYERGFNQFKGNNGIPLSIIDVESFLKEVNKVSINNREILLILIYSLKELKKAIIKGHGYYKYEDARQINKSIEDIRNNLNHVGGIDWVENIVDRNKILGWWD